MHHGVRPRWKSQHSRQAEPPKDHGSATRALNILAKNIRKGQDANQYLVLDISLFEVLNGLTCSPFGAVAKGSVPMDIDARIIHELSFPSGDSVNDETLPGDAIDITYDGAPVVARRIVELREAGHDTQMMTGDVKDVNAAFRHIPIQSDYVGRFSGCVPELGILVIDLSCPFGWTDAPGYYWVAGAAIKHLYEHSAPSWSGMIQEEREPFTCSAWCDDYICVKPDIGTRLPEANIALRSAMTEVLGPKRAMATSSRYGLSTARRLG